MRIRKKYLELISAALRHYAAHLKARSQDSKESEITKWWYGIRSTEAIDLADYLEKAK